MTRRGAAGLTVLALLSLGGCGDRTESYCSEVVDQKQVLQSLSEEAGEPGADLVGRSLEVFETLRSEAPDDLADEWDTFVLAWRGLDEALAAGGVDVADYDPDVRPEGLTEEEHAAIRAAAEQLRTPRVVEAASGIEQHSLDVCKTDLSTSGLDF